MNDMKQADERQSDSGCCGGPAPAGASACCDKAGPAPAEPGQQVLRGDSPAGLREAVRQHYDRVAQQAATCCGGPAADACSTSRALGYSAEELASLPEGANLGLGCGKPHALAALRPGEQVLDLGSGAGVDCFLAARQVGKSGHVIGIDMSAAMLAKARANAARGGYSQVEFRLGEIEHLPVADASIDVILSNCVINLSPAKSQVFAEAWRVLRPGGRLAVSDIVATAELPAELKQNADLYTGCMAGASLVSELEAMLAAAGFEQVRVLPKDESKVFIRDWAPGTAISDYIVSATIEAIKPAAA